MRLSYSRLSTYTECPELYRLKYVERRPEQPAVWSVGGTAFHTCAEWYLAGELGETPSPERVANAWATAWELAARELVERSPDAGPIESWRAAARGAEDARWWRVAGLEMVHDFIAWKQAAGAGLQVFQTTEPTGPRVWLEAELEVVLGGERVLAIPDALVVDEHGQLNVVDYKTGKPPKDALQLGVYAAVVEAAAGIRPAWGLYYMARDVRLLPIDLGRYPAEQVAARFAELGANLRAERFDPTPGPPCNYCPFRRDGCRYYAKETP